MKPVLKANGKYLRLVSNWPPRPIRDRKAHQAALKVLEELASSDMSTEELDYFEVVSILVESYEKKILEPDSQAEPHEILTSRDFPAAYQRLSAYASTVS